MDTKWIIGNWKLNGDGAFTDHFLESLKAGLLKLHKCSGVELGFRRQVKVVICPSFVYLPLINARLAVAIGTEPDLVLCSGAQSVSSYGSGACTGEVSATMLADVGCQYVLVGHSERRQLFGETDEEVAQRVVNALGAGLIPILCVGETLEERNLNKTLIVIERQLQAVMERLSEDDMEQILIAYEPVWAIGTGMTASAEQAQEIHQFIRKWWSDHEKFGSLGQEGVPVLYGGSVKSSNVQSLLSQPDIAGVLVGGASLEVDELLAIVEIGLVGRKSIG